MIRRFFVLLILTLSVSLGVSAQAKPHKTIPIEVIVDFGPAGKPAVRKQVEVSKGSTPKDAVSTVFPVMTGITCCDSREILSIDGVAVNPAENRWWVCSINGSKKKVSPHRTKLKAGDAVQWSYIIETQ